MFPGYLNAGAKIVGKLRTSDAAKTSVAEGFPSLVEAMSAAQINTPRRIAAFLTTLCFESWCEYNVHQLNDTRTYAGRGYIQLTGETNYGAAGTALSIPNLVGFPDLALSLDWSAKIATWYWTVNRPKCNEYADNLQMGMINAAIGYPLSGSNDSDRCMVFAQALRYLTQSETVEVVDCSRPPVFVTSEPKGQWKAPNGDLVNNNITATAAQAGPQTLTVYGPGRWKVDCAHNKNLTDPTVPPGKIKSYPCTQRNYTNRTIDSFTTLSASWATTYPADGEWDGAFDIWLGAWGNILGELMVWTHNRYNGPLPPSNATESLSASLDGNTFIAWRRPLNAGDARWYIALSMVNPKPEGTLDLAAVFRWLVGQGWLKGTDLIAAVEYGVEIANNAGKPATFWVDKYTLTDS